MSGFGILWINDERWLWLHRDGNLYSTEVCLNGRDGNESN